MATIRQARREDCPKILQFIQELAEYEKEPDAVEASVEILEESIYFFNFSTWRGKAGLYLEDLYVQPSHRGKGFGKLLLSYLASQAVKHNCPRFEWIVLDWNKPSIDFYEAMGAKPLSEWTVYRLENEALQDLAKSYKEEK